MIRRPPRSTLDRSSAASDVYKRQRSSSPGATADGDRTERRRELRRRRRHHRDARRGAVSYTHLRAHETVLDIVCRLLLEKKTLYFILFDVIQQGLSHYHTCLSIFVVIDLIHTTIIVLTI